MCTQQRTLRFSKENFIQADLLIWKVIIKVEPLLGALFILMEASWRSIIFWQIASPIPVPENSLLPCNRWKGWNILSIYFSSNPIPLSSKYISNSFLLVCLLYIFITGGIPLWWYLRELLIKFWNNCSIWKESAKIAGRFPHFTFPFVSWSNTSKLAKDSFTIKFGAVPDN